MKVGTAIIAALLGALLAACSSSGGGSTSLAGYGKSVDDVAKILGCQIVEPRDSDSLAQCNGDDGNSVLIQTLPNATQQGEFLALERDQGFLDCTLVVPGVLLSGENDEITVVLGEAPAAYATEHGGHVRGPC